MADKNSKTVIFEYEIQHNLTFSVNGNNVQFKPEEQMIYLMGMKIQPALEISTVEVLAHYPDGAEKTIADSIAILLKSTNKDTQKAIQGIPTKETAETTRRRETDAKLNKTSSSQASTIKNVNEALNAGKVMNVTVSSIQLKVSDQLQNSGSGFKITTKSERIAEFITATESKKIKIFINGIEIQPKLELEFIKRVFPQIDMTVNIE